MEHDTLVESEPTATGWGDAGRPAAGATMNVVLFPRNATGKAPTRVLRGQGTVS